MQQKAFVSQLYTYIGCKLHRENPYISGLEVNSEVSFCSWVAIETAFEVKQIVGMGSWFWVGRFSSNLGPLSIPAPFLVARHN
jgi:hypothetical protein